MEKISQSLSFLINLAKIQAVISRRLDSRLGGLGWNEFIILFHLSRAEGGKMRRIDLAEKVGLTASGVTRLLLPMEKVGYVRKEANKDDARVSLVLLAPGGKKRLEEAMDRAELFCEETIPSVAAKRLKEMADVISQLKLN